MRVRVVLVIMRPAITQIDPHIVVRELAHLRVVDAEDLRLLRRAQAQARCGLGRDLTAAVEGLSSGARGRVPRGISRRPTDPPAAGKPQTRRCRTAYRRRLSLP